MARFNNKEMFDKDTQNGNALRATNKGGEYIWYRCFGHIAATQCYTSGINNTGWNMPQDDRYTPATKVQQPINIKGYLAPERGNRRVIFNMEKEELYGNVDTAWGVIRRTQRNSYASRKHITQRN